MNYSAQTERIRQKLVRARETDRELKVFGAASHKYHIDRPLQPQQIAVFEETYGVSLPGSYAAFLTRVGNGGGSFRNSAAGPFYGIYPLGEGLDEFTDEVPEVLRRPAVIYPGMSDEYWAELQRPAPSEEGGSDAAWEETYRRLYGGILPLGSQGCERVHGLLLNGPHRGRVVNLSLERHKPRFAREAHFLDWYERWLDEILSGALLRDNAGWFGY